MKQTRPAHTRRLPRSFHGLVVIAAGSQSSEPLGRLLGQIPPWFPLPILIVQNCDRQREDNLAAMLRARPGVPVRQAREGQTLEPGVAFVAPPCRHAAVTPAGVLRIAQSPEDRGSPGAEGLFQSAAALFPARSVAVLLAGAGAESQEAADAIRRNGGAVIMEGAADTFAREDSRMSARGNAEDYVVPLSDIPSLLTHLVAR